MNVYEAKEISDEWRKCEDTDEFPERLTNDSERIKWLKEARWVDHLYSRHCRNNFMKALEALRECSTHSNSHCMSRCTLDTVLRRINAINETVKTAIKELEEVK